LDLLSLIYRRLPLTTLSQFPNGYFTKEDFRVFLENWLGHLEEWNDKELANVKNANKIAEDLGLTGNDQKTSLQLSNSSDNTQPAPWTLGLSLVLAKAARQLYEQHKPTALMPWIFIPDGQAFHFIMVYEKARVTSFRRDHTYFDAMLPVDSKVIQLLVPEPEINFIKNRDVSLDVAYVRHNRDAIPERKSQMDDLTEYGRNSDGVYIIWEYLGCYPWLRNYVKFGKTALTQLIEHESSEAVVLLREEMPENVSDAKVWIEDQLKLILNKGIVAE